MKRNKSLVIVGVFPLLAMVGCGGQQTVKEEPKAKAEPVKQIEVVEEEPAATTAALAASSSVIEVAPIEAAPMVADVVPEEKAVVEVAPVAESASHSAETPKAVESKPAAVEIPTEKNHFALTLTKKTPKHPFYGVGDTHGYSINGVEGAEIVLVRGERYVFQVNSSPMHDVYISEDNMGWGAKVVEAGVEGNFIYDGNLIFTPNENTPDVVYYQCQNHKAMGSRFFIVDKGESTDLKALIAKHGEVAKGVAGKKVKAVSADDVKKKLSYASLVAMSKPARRVKASSNADAIALLKDAQALLNTAKEKSAAGDNGEAMVMIDEALRKMSLASQMVPSEGVKDEQKQRYSELSKHLHDQRKTHAMSYQRTMKNEPDKAVKYDKVKVESLADEAEGYASSGNYQKAIVAVEEADRIVTSALNKMMDAQTVKYELNLDTPDGEYAYELDRYLGYHELVPVAIEQKKPSKGLRGLFDKSVEKSEAMQAEAEKYAANKDYPKAIRLMQEATKQLKRGLRMLGVKQ